MKHNQSWSLQKNLIYSLVLFGEIKTTKSRAKSIVGLVDRLVNKIKKGTVASKRDVLKVLSQKEAFEKLSNEIVPALTNRNSGYTKTFKLGTRGGDNASMVLMRWVSEPKIKETQVSADAGAKEPEAVKKEKEVRGKKK